MCPTGKVQRAMVNTKWNILHGRNRNLLEASEIILLLNVQVMQEPEPLMEMEPGQMVGQHAQIVLFAFAFIVEC